MLSELLTTNRFRGIFCELLQTRLFKSKRADAEIGAAVAGLHHLLGSELVGFWTRSGRNEGVDLEFVASNALHKVAQRFDAHRDDGAIANHVTTRTKEEGQKRRKKWWSLKRIKPRGDLQKRLYSFGGDNHQTIAEKFT